jgi:probable HAF family extracellular repeat protein
MKRKVLIPVLGFSLVLVFVGLGLVFSAGASVSPATGQVIVGSFQGLGSLLQGDGFQSQAWDVSVDGTTVVGNSGESAFLWTETTGMVALPGLPYSPAQSGGDGVSADGSIVAGSAYSQAGQEACRWTFVDGKWVPQGLGDLAGGGYYSVGYSMTPDGNVVVGVGTSAKGGEACRWKLTEGTWVLLGLGDLPGGSYASEAYGCSADGSVVVGQSAIKNGWRAFRWTAAKGMVDLGVAARRKWSAAWGCSADGSVVVGESFTNRGRDEVAFRWTAATGMVALGDLPGGISFSEADAVSPDGSIVVGGSMTAKGVEAFIWDATNGMRRVADYLADHQVFVPIGWTLRYANGVTVNAGVVTIVGVGINLEGKTEAWRAVVVPNL